MSSHIVDSQIYGGTWGSQEMRAIFDEVPRTQGWLDVIAALARAQADLGLIPEPAAEGIHRNCSVDLLDLDAMGDAYAASGHSLHGLIGALKDLCDDGAGEWICYGATVHDITDTWMSAALLEVWEIVLRDLRSIEDTMMNLATQHRDTPMTGRTHGQAALPITFGFKVAVWIRENRRHIERLKDVRKRLGVGQLCGAVGSLATFGDKGLELQERFCASLGLATPDIAWISARDAQAEFVALLAMIAATYDKIGHEVYSLQRTEIGELREKQLNDAVGSITMPHKQNPEVAEHLGTLARIIRHQSAALLESLVHDHERDGRSWKVEWGTIGPTCVMMGALLTHARRLCEDIQVDKERMRQNIEAASGFMHSERVLVALADQTGRYTAHRLVGEASRNAVDGGTSLEEAVSAHAEIRRHLASEAIHALFGSVDVGRCPEFVDRVIARTTAERAEDPSPGSE